MPQDKNEAEVREVCPVCGARQKAPRAGSQTDLALRAISAAGKPIPNRDLCVALDDIGPYVARTMAKLRERGLVKNVGSGQFALYDLTDAGRAALSRATSKGAE